jgi:REP element-mobilizing transposase RayT
MQHRKPNRLKNYDYSQNGMYFITICTKDKKCFFGEIINDKMILNDFGKIIQNVWLELPNHNDNISIDEFVIMPNHIHGIIEIVGTPLVGVQDIDTTKTGTRPVTTISELIGTFKSLTTNQYIYHIKNNGWKPFNKYIWQRSFYDHIIRKEESLNKIREYIMINPQQWNDDKNNPLD